MLPQWIIEKKRDAKALSEDEIQFFIEGYTNGDIPDYQMAALAMAIYLNGMNFTETTLLTEAMMNSGDLVDTSSIDLPKMDKHSTGGIGDKVSLILAPLIACCDLAVPMISGRGLGITGGTLDKLESIPGYRTDLEEKVFVKVVRDCGCSISGQTGQLAPADKKLYALRDVTATVPSIPLIVASIMSKKLAEGIDGLVLDVKWGKGAFMKTDAQAKELARNLVEVGHRMGKKTAALLTDMNQPLGTSAGNALEVVESIESLSGNGSDDLMEVTMALASRLLMLAGKATEHSEALGILQKHISSGAALERFGKMVGLQGGDPSVIDDPKKLLTAKFSRAYKAPKSGFIENIDADRIGRACVILGAGRVKTEDLIDHAVGVSDIPKISDAVEEGQTLLTVHANDEGKLEEAMSFVREAFKISGETSPPESLIRDTILPEGAS